MAYNTLTKDSGGDNSDRAIEAHKIVVGMGLLDKTEEMKPHEREFVESIAERLEQYADLTLVSTKQLFWLRDLKERYL